MDSFRISELIKLSVVSRLNEKDSKELLDSMNRHKDFPLDELGMFQNLAAMLSLPIEQFKPSLQTKQKILELVNNNLTTKVFSDEPSSESEKNSNIFSKLKSEEQDKENTISSTLKIKEPDLTELVIFDRSKEFEEVRSRVAKLREQKKEHIQQQEIEKIKLSPSKISEKTYNTSRGKKKVKKILLAAGLFIALLAFTGVFYFKMFDDETLQASNDVDQMHKEMIAKSIVEETNNKNEVYSASNQEQSEQLSEERELENVVVESSNEIKEENENFVENKKTAEDLPPLEKPKIIEAPLTDPVVEKEDVKIEQSTLLAGELPPDNGKKAIEEEQNYFIAVEEMPEPIGGLSTIQSKIVYPELAVRAGVEGKVYIRAFVDENGSVTKAEVINGIGMGCDEAAINAVLSTKFKPGKQRGKPIKVQVTVAITFKL